MAGALVDDMTSVAAHWTGGAADACADYVSDVGAAIEYEGPLNRTVARVGRLAGEALEQAARFVITTLNEVVRQIKNALSSFWGFIDNLLNIKDRIDKYRSLFEQGKALVDNARAVFEAAQAVIEVAQDPVGAVRGEIADAFQPVVDQLDEVESDVGTAHSVAEAATDLTDLADGSALADQPTADLDLGDDLERPSE